MPTLKRVSSARAFAHIDAMIEQHPGLSGTHFAALAGISPSIVSRRGHLMTVDIEERILAVTPRHVRLLPPRHVPAARALAQLQRLLAHPNVSMFTISKMGGPSYQTLYNLQSGRYRMCHYRTHVRLMNLTVEDTLTHASLCAPERSVQHIRCLEANGWPLTALSAISGVHVQSVLKSTYHVQRVTRDAIATMYDRLGDTPGPDVRSAHFARSLGFYPPINYDEDGNLIPGSVRSVDRRDREHHSRAKLIALTWLLDGLSIVDAAGRVGETADAINVARRRAGLLSPTDGTSVRATPEVAERVMEALNGIDRSYPTDAADDEDIDYTARWRALCHAADPAKTDDVAA